MKFSKIFSAIGFCFFAISAQAITIDEFEGAVRVAEVGQQFSNASNGINIPADSSGRSSVIGSNRKFEIISLAGVNDLYESKIGSGYGALSHSQDIRAKAISRVIWDGSSSGAINHTGLGGIDFTQDASTAIVIDIERFDLPFGRSIELEVVMYSSLGQASSAVVNLDTPVFEPASSIPTSDWVAPNKVVIPFSSFVKKASLPVDFTAVGAVELVINGTSTDAADLSIVRIGTDSCPYVPDANNAVVDDCGVCNGDNSSCSDCLGVPYGPDVPGTACDNGETGVCDGGTFTATCACERNIQPTDELCDGLDNDCDGQIDESFPALGTTCGIGSGVCEFHGTYICSPDKLGLKCDDQELLEDQAEACEESKGCDEVPGSGLEFDDCGVCGGDNSSCTDCKGVLHGTAKKDRCGICNGDGQSCLNCNSYDQSNLLTDIDGGSLKQERLVNKFNRALLRQFPTKANKRFVAKVNSEASKLQVANWSLTWTLPKNVTSCSNTTFCVSASNQDRIVGYRQGSEALRQLAQKVIRRLKRLGAQEAQVKRMEIQNNRQHDHNMKFVDQVPVVQSVCSK